MVDVVAYTDGGCRMKNGDVGAWAFVLIHTSSRRALARADAVSATTSQRMELMAAIEALRAVKGNPSVLIRSDSRYVIKACTAWMDDWRARGYRRKGGELMNVDLIKELDELNQRYRPSWQHVKGHSGEPGNDFVDGLVNDAMDRLAEAQDAAHERRFEWSEMLPGRYLGSR